MITLARMGRRPLGREKANLTLPPDLKQKAEELADAESRPLSHMVQELLQSYVNKNWTEAMRKQPKRRRAR